VIPSQKRRAGPHAIGELDCLHIGPTSFLDISKPHFQQRGRRDEEHLLIGGARRKACDNWDRSFWFVAAGKSKGEVVAKRLISRI
jgi:hypothetical protein